MAGDDTDMDKQFKDLKINQSDINILLLGETGVGKSTFINAIANYLTFPEMKKAEREHLVLIPSQFTVTDKNSERRNVDTGVKDKNEFLVTGESATQDVKTYVFPIYNNQANIRLIDTPGMGDTRGIQQDDINSENILSYIGQLHELHAICFLFKPNMSRNTVFFQYCITQILSRLDKSASKNIVFVFTNSRGSDYGPGDTIALLKKTVEEIKKRPPNVDIPLNRNIFCFDNESFRYLAAMKSGVEFDSASKERYKESWKKSSDQCWKLIRYIVGDSKNAPVKPHHVKSTNAVNEARRMIMQLSQPLAEIVQNINQNLDVLHRHEQDLKLNYESLDTLKAKLYMPVLSLEATKLTQPTTVCTSRSCAEIYQVSGKNNWHYKQRCHDPCYLSNVPKEMIGAPELMNCASMNRSDVTNVCCIKCKCMYSVHMHIYYMTKVVEKREKDANVEKNINTKEKIVQSAKKLIEGIKQKKDDLEEEHKVIVRCSARFAHFLQNNAITPFNDSYKEYIEYLINREKSLGPFCDMQTVDFLRKMLQQYDEAKKAFDDALAANKKIGIDEGITPKAIQDSISDLYKLKHNGKKIKELYECQKSAVKKEHENTEYVHKSTFKREDKKEKKDKKEDKKDKKDDKKDKKDEKKDKKDEKKDKKDEKKDKKGGSTRYETQRSSQPRSRTPPPSYQDANRSRQPPRGPLPPQQGPYPPQGPYPHPGPYTPGPASHPYTPYYPPGSVPVPPAPQYGAPGAYHPPPPGVDPYRPYDYKDSKHDNPPQYDIRVTVDRSSEPHTPPVPDPHYPYNHPNYGHPSYPGHYPPPPPPPGQHYPPPPPPAGYYPPPPAPYGAPYDSHHGVNRHSEDPQYRRDNSRRGNDRSRGYRGGKSGVNKNYNKTSKKKKEQKKENKKSSSGSGSDGSSS